MSSGGYVSDEITNQIVAERLTETDCEAGFLLDGLSAVDSDATTLSFTGPTRPAVLTGKRLPDAAPGDVADYRYLLMPVRVQ